MATEKTWYMSGNVNLNGSSTLEVAQNFMYELYNTLSGGNENSDAKWEIVSASDGAGNIFSGGPPLQPSDFVFNTVGYNHSYFLARKDTLLPQTGSGGRYIYFYADCEDNTAATAFFAFDHEPPGGAGTATNRPQETANAFEKNGQRFVTGYDASFPTYYHSIIDTTGSFHIVTARGNNTTQPCAFAMSCARLETPRTGTADPYPVFMKLGYQTPGTHDNYQIGGPWSIGATTNPGDTDWNDIYGKATGMWRTDGTAVTADYQLMMIPSSIWNQAYVDAQYNPWSNFRPTASPIDGTWPLLPVYLYSCSSTTTPLGVRGRLPDVHMGNNQFYIGGAIANSADVNWLAGATVPATGTPTHACVGQFWLPFSASLLPGLA